MSEPSDLVERLNAPTHRGLEDARTMREAADEIERLRQHLAELGSVCDSYADEIERLRRVIMDEGVEWAGRLNDMEARAEKAEAEIERLRDLNTANAKLQRAEKAEAERDRLKAVVDAVAAACPELLAENERLRGLVDGAIPLLASIAPLSDEDSPIRKWLALSGQVQPWPTRSSGCTGAQVRVE